jgi:DNA-binding CsgD family transcriptional regulator
MKIGHESKLTVMSPRRQSPECLTAREREVADVMHLSTKDVALALEMNYWTARAHLGNIFRKLGVSKRGEAVKVWMELRAEIADVRKAQVAA